MEPSPHSTGVRVFLSGLAGRAAVALRRGLRMPRLVLRRTAEVVLALIVLFEEWGWRPLADLLAGFARLRPVAKLENAIAALPPYLALVAFALPTLLFLPLKLIAVYLIARGQVFFAGALFLAAKVFGTALVARLFQLTHPALMQIPWFAWAYGHFATWKDQVFSQIRSTWAWRYGRLLKARVKKEAAQAWSQYGPRAMALLDGVRRRVRSLFGQGPA